MAPISPYLDIAGFRKAWTAFPPNRCEKSFWMSLEVFCQPFLDVNYPLRSLEFFSMPHTGRTQLDDLHLIDAEVVALANEQRALYDAFTLWNPLAIANILKAPIGIVIEQLLLAVEYKMLSMHFVLCCRSCGYDIARYRAVSEITFVGTYHVSNVVMCPMCSDLTQISSLADAKVFFQLDKLHPIFHRQHHRMFFTEVADKRRLETFFCPAGAGFAFTAKMPRGRYLMSCPFAPSLVELEVEVDAELMGDRDPYVTRIVDLKLYNPNTAKGRIHSAANSPRSMPLVPRKSIVGRMAEKSPSMGGGASLTTPLSYSRPPAGACTPNGGTYLVHADSSSSTNNNNGVSGFGAAFPAHAGHSTHELPLLTLKHGKVQFRVYNDTQSSGFLDLFIAFDTRTEFSAITYPTMFSVAELMHCAPRGLRSPLLSRFVPKPPSTTSTAGIYVRHIFELDGDDFDDPSVIAVLREVHRYSLEDHQGLLLDVSCGGTSFESTFLTVTAALASCICFFQRVLVRAGERVALALRCSITEGPLKLTSYQGQYNDADNMRSPYPPIQFVGPVVYVSTHPPISAPRLVYEECESPRVPISGIRSRLSSIAFLDQSTLSSLHHQQLAGGSGLGGLTMIRFEMRSVCVADDGYADVSRGSICLRDDLRVRGIGDLVLPYFLKYLCEQFEGTTLTQEPHALVLQMPLSVIQASVQMSTILDRNSYTKELLGPF